MDPNNTERGTRGDDGVDKWLQLVKTEFNELPGMHLTKPQIGRLFGLNPETCDAVVNALEQVDFLRCTPSNGFVKADLER
jgi:hypothetical protein